MEEFEGVDVVLYVDEGYVETEYVVAELAEVVVRNLVANVLASHLIADFLKAHAVEVVPELLGQLYVVFGDKEPFVGREAAFDSLLECYAEVLVPCADILHFGCRWLLIVEEYLVEYVERVGGVSFLDDY